MPIVKDGNGVAIEYHIPQDVTAKIPDYFYFAVVGGIQNDLQEIRYNVALGVLELT